MTPQKSISTNVDFLPSALYNEGKRKGNVFSENLKKIVEIALILRGKVMNPRLAKTKESLLLALLRMMDSCPLEEVTVSALCKEAGVNRTTFYKYYAVPEDLITEAVEDLLKNVMHLGEGLGKSVYEYLLLCCQHFQRNQKLMQALMDSRTDLSSIFFRLAQSQYDISFMYRDENTFITGGIMNVMRSWMHRGFIETPEEMAQIITNYVDKVVS